MKTTWPDRPRRHNNHYDKLPIGCNLQFLDSGSFTVWKNKSGPFRERHPELGKFAPLKFYILRGSETLYGHLKLLGQN